jgi:IS605 OrfB family transposase
MERTGSFKLLTSPQQTEAFSELARLFSEACNGMVPFVQEHRCWNRVGLHHLVYYPIRERFPALGSQMVCQAVHRVADAYKALRANEGIPKDQPVPAIKFTPSSVSFDHRTYSIKGEAFSLFTTTGRTTVRFACGPRQKALLGSGLPKEARLAIRKGKCYLNLVFDLPDPIPLSGDLAVGLDVGENNLAATSTGKVLGGGKLRHDRDRYLASRRRLQSNGSRASKRKLKAISGKEQRHVRHVNHETSKAIVAQALQAGACILRMEDLTHIRAHIKAGNRVRARLHRWAFRQLQNFVQYKAEAAGIKVEYVDPAYTSQTCSVCGGLGKRVKHRFACSCGNLAHSDVNASRNIARFAALSSSARGVVNRPEFAHRVHPCVVESSSL